MAALWGELRAAWKGWILVATMAAWKASSMAGQTGRSRVLQLAAMKDIAMVASMAGRMGFFWVGWKERC